MITWDKVNDDVQAFARLSAAVKSIQITAATQLALRHWNKIIIILAGVEI